MSQSLEHLRVPALTGGVNETAQRLGTLTPADLLGAQNARRVGSGRLGLRPHLLVGPTLTDADCVLGAVALGTKAIFLGWDTSAEAVLLYEWDWSTSPLTGKTFSDATADTAKKWSTGVTSRLAVRMVVFDDSVFICSTNGSKALAYYSVGDSNVTLVAKLDMSAGTDNHAIPRWLEVYRNHLFMFGWLDEDNPSVGHAVRWSKPGVAKAAGDWNAIDYDYIGHEGDDIHCAFATGEHLAILKAQSIHAIYGFASANFTLRELNHTIGCLGSRCAQEWSGQIPFIDHDGKPRILVGTEPLLLDAPVRDSLELYDPTAITEAWVAVEPDTDTVLYALSRAGESAPTRPLAFDLRERQWLGTWNFPSTGATTYREFFAAASLVRQVLPGPAAAPSNLDEGVVYATTYSSTWTNGDNTPGCVSIIERKEDAPTPGAYADVSTEIPVTDPSYYLHTVEEKHTYTARCRHKRNAQETAEGSRPTKQTLTKCATAPIQLGEPVYNPDTELWNVELFVTAQSGRAGATSKISLYESIDKEAATLLQSWTGRTDAGSPTQLSYDKNYAAGTDVRFSTIVEDEASTWPDSDYSYLYYLVGE